MDIVVLGGGIAGLTVANLLASNKSLTIAVIETKLPQLDWEPNGYDIRCSAITRAAQAIFAHLGIWRQIIDERASAYNKMLVWDNTSNKQLNFSATDINEPDLGHIIENRVMQRALYKKLLQHANVEFICGTVDKLQQLPDRNLLSIGSRIIECKLVIGADGLNSWLRNNLSIPSYGWDYQHSALVATIKSELPHQNTAMQRFAPDGPLAFLPLLQQDLTSIVWSSQPSKIKELLALEPDEFCKQLELAFDFKLGKLQLHGIRASFPLRMHHVTKYVLPRVALLGDAAHGIHPLAGQGLNLGILDAAELANVIQTADAKQLDIGSLAVLRKYERARKVHNWGMIVLVESFKQVFAVKNNLFIKLRGHGLGLLNDINIAKRAVMHFALGTRLPLPVTNDA